MVPFPPERKDPILVELQRVQQQEGVLQRGGPNQRENIPQVSGRSNSERIPCLLTLGELRTSTGS